MRLSLLISLFLLISGIDTHAQVLIPDTYGYTLSHSDSLNGPSYQWIDISNKGQEVMGLEDDNWVGPIEMGISFPYYWYQRDKIWISDNGVIAFQANPIIADLAPIGFPLLPEADGKEDLLAPLMTDLTFLGNNNPARVFTWTDTANDRFVISYYEVPFFGNNALGYAGSNTFQVILDAQDSSITFQYEEQQGGIDPLYLNNRSYPLVIGIEDLTGTFGLTISDSLLEVPVALRMDPPVQPLVEAKDVRSFWLAQMDNRGFFRPYVAPPAAPRPSFSAVVGNIGNAPFLSPTEALFGLYTELGFNYLKADTVLPPFAKGARDTLEYNLPFPLPFPTTYSLTLTLTNDDDINSKNDSLMVEMVVVDTIGGSPWLSYVTDMDEPMRADGIEGKTDTTGRSGIGAYYRPFGNPVEVEDVEFFFSPYPDSFGKINQGDAYRVEIYGESKESRKPGDLLFSQVIAAQDVIFGKWVGLDVVPPVLVDSGGFYIAWIPLSDSLALLSESATSSPPISRQTFEIQNGIWKAHRSDQTKDFWIRTRVNTSRLTAVDPELQEEAAIRIFPNPGDGLFFIEMEFEKSTSVKLRVFDVVGKYVSDDYFLPSNYLQEFVDLRMLPEGMYLLHFQYDDQSSSRWVKIQHRP